MVRHAELEDVLPGVISEDRYPDKPNNHYSPSQISGCELKVYLDRMLETDVTLNSWMFQGKAVHYYLQENDILTEALHDAGYHWVNTNYEVSNVYGVDEEIVINGTADVVARDCEDDTVVYDIKYTALQPDSSAGRILKYMTQAHTYAQMFEADGYGLLMIHSRADDLEEGVGVMEGTMSEENWSIVQDKVECIHYALKAAGYFDGNTWEIDEIETVGIGFWEEVIDHFDAQRIPTFDKECKYCDHAGYCPINQGTLAASKGVGEMVENTKGSDDD